MRRLLLLFALSVPLMLAACDSSGDDPQPVDVTVRPTYMGDLVPSATLHAEGEQVGTGETTLTREQGTSLSVRAEAEGFEDATASISFDAPHTESLSLAGDSVMVNLRAEGADSDALLSDATLFVDDTEVGTGEAQIIRVRSDEELSLRAEAASFDPADTTITLDESHDVTLALLDDSVSVTVRAQAADGDTLIADASLFFEGEQIGTGEVTVRRERSDRDVEVKAEAEFFEGPVTQTVALDRDREALLSMNRREVSISVRPKIVSGPEYYVDGQGNWKGYVDISADNEEIGDAWVGPFDSRRDSVVTFTHLMSRRGVSIRSRHVYRPFPATNISNPEKYAIRRVAVGDTTITPDQDREAILALQVMRACSDEIDSDGDGDSDARDFGCVDGFDISTDANGRLVHYEPSDVNEVTKGFLSELSTGFQDTVKVSSREGEREALWIDTYLNDEPALAVSFYIDVAIDTRREADQDGETFALRYETGTERGNITNVNTSDIVADENEQDGRDITQVQGIDRTFFINGGYMYRDVYVVHGTKAADELPGDGNDDVIFAYPTETFDDRVALYTRWFYEPEEVPNNSSSQVATQAGATAQTVGDGRQCRETEKGEVCTQVLLNPKPSDEWPSLHE